MMDGSAAGGDEPGFAELIAWLARFREETLRHRPSDRELGKAAGDKSPTTIGAWLRGERFPQRVDELLLVVAAIRRHAGRTGSLENPRESARLQAELWRRAYRDEAERRAGAIRTGVEAAQARVVLGQMSPGRPLEEETDPFSLEVHHAIEQGSAGLPVLPEYVEREHDRRLADLVTRAAGGASSVAVLVGGSSTGKTRACWEALHLLRGRPEPWRLWHPMDPARMPAELARVGPYTVIWLNDARQYFDDQPAERIALGLRELLRDSERRPVLLLATLWPGDWQALTKQDGSHVKKLLEPHTIEVPDTFFPVDPADFAEKAKTDPRLSEAARAPDRQITQYLAGVPVLLDRYRFAEPASKALIWAAMDARRLGHGPQIPLDLLTEAAPGYLTRNQERSLRPDWLAGALSSATTPCNGIPGILLPVVARDQDPREAARPGDSTPLYRLADYLDQHDRYETAEESDDRQGNILPPASFWDASVRHVTDPSNRLKLAKSAFKRRLYRHFVLLLIPLMNSDIVDVRDLFFSFIESTGRFDEAISWLQSRAAAGDPDAMWQLYRILRDNGQYSDAAHWLQTAARHGDLPALQAI